jgi:hypothetical protein
MNPARPIASAPMDGSTVMVHWTDAAGQENQSLARYRSREQLRAAGGDWDESDVGWWIFVDGDTRKRIEPHSWNSGSDAGTD